ncbi:MAG: signal recognition particle protein [Phycisphaerales bacterium]|jgi:signal recognition particle subunit SRP54|nr:signal recognition particle protein [Phycisphaerales bacterium]MBT7171497.1 signal recognition particle protein [Phycisphaerales bacterium]
MFESLTNKFNDVFRKMSGRGRINEANVRESMQEVRTALLEADVHYDVVRKFCDDIVEIALGTEVIESLRPGELMIKIVHDEMVKLMGPADGQIYYVKPGPTVIMMAGLQGSGKTTTCGKLAKFMQKGDRRVLLTACDLQRPAAVDQLEIVAGQVGAEFFKTEGETNPVKVARKAVTHARSTGVDVVVIDTAGRLHVDEEMMKQAEDIAKATNPHQIFLVCDAMTGQDAVNSAREFNERLELDGVILSKFDSDARGGAALSVKAVTGKPIKFMGVGETFDALEEFHPDRMAGRILGMGDVVSLVEKAQETFDVEEQEKMQAKMAKGEFTLTDFLKQMRQMTKMGPLKSIMKMMPGMGGQNEMLDSIKGDEVGRMEAIINSMTKAERNEPGMIDIHRRRRIARGSGTKPEDVSGLVKSFTQMANMMKQMAGMGVRERMAFAKQMASPGGMGAMASGGMGKVKGSTKMGKVNKRKLKQKNKRKKRRR